MLGLRRRDCAVVGRAQAPHLWACKAWQNRARGRMNHGDRVLANHRVSVFIEETDARCQRQRLAVQDHRRQVVLIGFNARL